MPHYAIVITDPLKHHDAEVARHVEANLTHHAARRSDIGPREREALRHRIEQAVRSRVGAPRQAGDLHTTADVECPDGGTNCRNCGDPAFHASCRAAGHCPHCGTRHGIAPDSYLVASGVELVEVEPPRRGAVWNRQRRAFDDPTP